MGRAMARYNACYRGGDGEVKNAEPEAGIAGKGYTCERGVVALSFEVEA